MKILIIDAYNMMHRAKHGFRFGNDGMTFGFFRCLKSEIDRHLPDKVYVVSEGRPHHRFELFPDYKANRVKKPDPDFNRQRDDIFKICTHLPVTFVRHPDYECDDCIAFLTSIASQEDQVVICSSDSDFIQLLSRPNVSLWNPVKKKFIETFETDYVTWKSLAGDGSDNIPGMPGVGNKTALKLASDTQKLDEYFLKYPERKKDFDNFRKIIEFAFIDPDDEKIDVRVYNFNEVNLYESFNDRDFRSILGKSWDSWKETMQRLEENVDLQAG